MFAGHELKLLNFSVIVYILLGALIFHSLGEFEPIKFTSNSKDESAQDLSKRPQGDSSNNKSSRATIRSELDSLRLGSVRRMWNITNQLNILYEANWTELVLDELVEYERQFLDSLERFASTQSQAADDSQSLDDEDSSSDGKDQDQDEERQKKAKKSRAKLRTAEERIRLESIKKSLVHSLATITTMGSPLKPPHSQLGRLVTILYGAIGIPLLVVSVAKSGQHLARVSLNCLLVMRHYCFALPLHYLCCSCNLFVCLRLLSWCCCCCCCSYLFCWADKKQKCCDYGNAPKLKLHPTNSRRRRAGAKRKRAKRQASERAQAEQQQQQQVSSTFVIGFDAQKLEQQSLNEQKSVRFLAESSNDTGSESESDAETAAPADQNESWRLLVSSLVVLGAYLCLGALYQARQHDLQLVDALFACFSMLSTSKLPDSFNLDGDAPDPLAYYKSNLRIVNKKAQSQLIATVAKNRTELANRLIVSDKLTLLVDSVYLLVGLNVIAACAQFARLWYDGTVRRRFSADCPMQQKKPTVCNGLQQAKLMPAASGSLMGSFEHRNNQFANNMPPQPSSAPRQGGEGDDGQSFSMKQFTVLAHQNQSSPVEAMETTEPNQLNLSELFVLDADSSAKLDQQQPIRSIYHAQYQHQHSDGASFASSSSQAAPSLCAHHQKSTLAALGQASDDLQPTMTTAVDHHHHNSNHHNHHHHHHHHAQHNQFEQRSTAQMNSVELQQAKKLRHSSSSLQLFEVQPFCNSHEPNSAYNSMATLTRRSNGNNNNHPSHMVQYAPMTNGFEPNTPNGGPLTGPNEPDSSPNTFDTTNSQTISSSMSSRAAIVMKPIRIVGQQPRPSAGEKAVSWFENGQQ